MANDDNSTRLLEHHGALAGERIQPGAVGDVSVGWWRQWSACWDRQAAGSRCGRTDRGLKSEASNWSRQVLCTQGAAPGALVP